MAQGSFTPEMIELFRRSREQRGRGGTNRSNRDQPRTLSEDSMQDTINRRVQRQPEGSIPQPLGPLVTKTEANINTNLTRNTPSINPFRGPTLLARNGRFV